MGTLIVLPCKNFREDGIIMGYTKFSSVDYILNYSYSSKEELIEAISSLKAMYEAGNISKQTYSNTLALLEDKLRSL